MTCLDTLWLTGVLSHWSRCSATCATDTQPAVSKLAQCSAKYVECSLYQGKDCRSHGPVSAGVVDCHVMLCVFRTHEYTCEAAEHVETGLSHELT